MPEREVRILLIEDDEDDYVLAAEMLAEAFGPAFALDWAPSWRRALEAIREARHDVYLVDYRLGERNGLELVREAAAAGRPAPFILLTGQGSRAVDLEAMRAGAAAYLVKGECTAPLLDRAIRYAIERHKSERRLAERARFDPLTGLANRDLFRDHLARATARADRGRQPVAVLVLDLDRFKAINDTHGHEAGDRLLRHIAERLNACVRESDLVARLGGDEFAVVMDGLADPAVAGGLATRILEVVKIPVDLGRAEVATSASIGIAVYPTDVGAAEELVASADAAMYRAKEQGGDRFHFFTTRMRAAAAERLELERRLRAALEREEFRLYYQPQVELRSGRLSGMEALVRWQHPRRGLVGPGEFVPLAEACGLIVPLGEWVLRTACRQLRAWHLAGRPPIRVAVNLSALQFQDDDLAGTVARVLDECGLAACFLVLEITERTLLKDPGRIEGLLKAFDDMGIQVALDDFGTGFSSLNHLRSFPGALIKIDRSFIGSIGADPHGAAIVRSVITMAHDLGLGVIAEGLETPEQLAFLRGCGCDTVQGYLIAPPAPAEAIPPDLFLNPPLPVPGRDVGDGGDGGRGR